ncbi:MAG: outer membrane homotrimeric porin [Desulfovibrio sp.]|nr:outer membrane homotrimeric porin [Desulfovibrio sp.]
MKKGCMVLMLAAGMLLGATSGAEAIDFKAKGQWQIAFGVGNAQLNGARNQGRDLFGAMQRFRIQLDAIASENLSGRVWFEIGTQDWGNGNNGGALGADGNNVIKVKNAFIDWLVPETDLKIRMGIQNVYLPNAAGGSNVFGNGDVAGITASYQFTDEVGLTAFWYRPANDNFANSYSRNGVERNNSNYLDNIDLFGVAVPVTLDGFEITPWVLYGMLGRNALKTGDGRKAVWDENGNVRFENQRNRLTTADGHLWSSLLANPGNRWQLGDFGSDRAYSSMFFAGLPIKVTAWDPLNIEFDVNYGYVEGFGKTTVNNYKFRDANGNPLTKRAETKREGWLIKALVEYKMDWGVPGIFGWYASGDDGDVKNGSERMPSLKSNGRFTSFMGAAGTDWYGTSKGSFNEKHTNYAGTWGIGLQVRDMSFLEDLKHTFRVALWGGTNDPSMVKYFESAKDWNIEGDGYEGPYLTTNDNLIEFNLDNTYKIYENLAVNLDFGYIVNCMDQGTWKHSRSWAGGRDNFSQRDAWKVQMTFNYTF